MQQSQSGITRPRKNQLRGAPHADHLIEKDVGAESNQSEVAPLLPDDFMPGRKRHEMTESLERHTVAVMNVLLDRVPKSCKLHHEPDRSKSPSNTLECKVSVSGR